MTGYYTRTFAGLLVVLTAAAGAALFANAIARDARRRYDEAVSAAQASSRRSSEQHQRTTRLTDAVRPVRAFASAWNGLVWLSEKDAAERTRTAMESIAQRQLGLVTDSAITPQAQNYRFCGIATRVQKVTLRASGKDLAALLAWLGKVEERYPAAVVELVEFSSNVGGSTALTLRLAEPVTEFTPASRSAFASRRAAVETEDVADNGWDRYMPAAVKGSIPVGFSRNPLQPAVAAEARPFLTATEDAGELAPRIESALAGHVSSVIRGAVPLVVIDGRVFRVGDEVVVGRAHERPIPHGKTKLKRIGNEQLVLQVYLERERTTPCDIGYPLPAFLQAR